MPTYSQVFNSGALKVKQFSTKNFWNFQIYRGVYGGKTYWLTANGHIFDSKEGMEKYLLEFMGDDEFEKGWFVGCLTQWEGNQNA